jgi:integrase
VLKVINKALKDIGELIGFNNLELTTYVTRHSYATHLNEISNISLTRQALGHGNERQTETYLAKIKPVKLDKANRKILDLISHSSN